MKKEEPFEKCPQYQNEHFLIRKMEKEDAGALFLCYSDKEAAKFFNGDACGDNFYYTDYVKFLDCMKFWKSRYEVRDFVRFSIIDIVLQEAIGMVEICPTKKYSVDEKWIGILRIDLKSEYEWAYEEILQCILPSIYEDFGVDAVLTKAQKYAEHRRQILKNHQFVFAMDECNISYNDYYIRY
jgi:ribosomal-protein-alanine N-acetyltransferase